MIIKIQKMFLWFLQNEEKSFCNAKVIAKCVEHYSNSV